jgi:p24 family protein beta-1
MRGILLIFLLSLINLNLAYIITVDSHAEECFFDHAQAGSKLGEFFLISEHNKYLIQLVLGLMFETIEGGFLDIDVRIVGPDGKVIYQVIS